MSSADEENDPAHEENDPADDAQGEADGDGSGEDVEADDGSEEGAGDEGSANDALDDAAAFNAGGSDGDDANGEGVAEKYDGEDAESEAESKNLRIDVDRSLGNKEEHAVVECNTSAGPFTLHLHRSWAPNGYDRATALFEQGYYDHSHFFRVVPHFLVQFGIGYPTDERLNRFAKSTIKDDPKRSDLMPFKEGYISFAGSGKDSRSSHLFIAYDHAQNLGTAAWETPFGEVVEGMEDTVRKFYAGYGDMPPWGKGPEQGKIYNRGVSYINEEYPLLDKFESCQVKRMSSLPSVDAKTKSNEAGMSGVLSQEANLINKLSDTQDLPFIKLVVLLGVVVLVILGCGFSRRKKRKVGKSV